LRDAIPVIFVLPPILTFDLIPTPPDTTNEPVNVLVDSVALLRDAIPVIFVLPPILTFDLIPTPPDTTNEPVDVLIDSVVLLRDAIPVILVLPPILTLDLIPTPPNTTNEPVDVVVDSVPSFNRDMLDTFRALFKVVVPVILVLPPILTLDLIPTPPDTTNEPVDVLVD
jgi:hypothetical protein